MRIIQRGRTVEGEELGTACRHCETQFAFKEPEAERTLDARGNEVYRMTCPACGYVVERRVFQPRPWPQPK